MTDFSGKFVVYYNISQFNQPPLGATTTPPIPARFQISLEYPLLNKTSDYAVSVIKAKFDTSAMVAPFYVPPNRPDGSPPLPSSKLIDKILIQSANISVIGSLYANNLQSQTILDVDYRQDDTSTPLYFQPPYPQCLTLNNPTPLQVIDMNIVVQFEDGSQTPLLVPSDSSWSVRLGFIRRF